MTRTLSCLSPLLKKKQDQMDTLSGVAGIIYIKRSPIVCRGRATRIRLLLIGNCKVIRCKMFTLCIGCGLALVNRNLQ